VKNIKYAFIKTNHSELYYYRQLSRDYIINALLPFISDGIRNHIIFTRAVCSTINLQDFIECSAYGM
jgi:hypothetical protein